MKIIVLLTSVFLMNSGMMAPEETALQKDIHQLFSCTIEDLENNVGIIINILPEGQRDDIFYVLRNRLEHVEMNNAADAAQIMKQIIKVCTLTQLGECFPILKRRMEEANITDPERRQLEDIVRHYYPTLCSQITPTRKIAEQKTVEKKTEEIGMAASSSNLRSSYEKALSFLRIPITEEALRQLKDTLASKLSVPLTKREEEAQIRKTLQCKIIEVFELKMNENPVDILRLELERQDSLYGLGYLLGERDVLSESAAEKVFSYLPVMAWMLDQDSLWDKSSGRAVDRWYKWFCSFLIMSKRAADSWTKCDPYLVERFFCFFRMLSNDWEMALEMIMEGRSSRLHPVDRQEVQAKRRRVDSDSETMPRQP